MVLFGNMFGGAEIIFALKNVGTVLGANTGPISLIASFCDHAHSCIFDLSR